jgi:hypothetical protein
MMCRCGCGGWTRGGRFLPGHDARLKGQLLRAARGLDNSVYGRDEAVDALARLGWSHFLLRGGATRSSRGSRTRALPAVVLATNRTFGVELEILGLTPTMAADALNAAGVPAYAEGYNHTTRSHWKAVPDGSLRGDLCCEVVSPILSGQSGLDELEQVCRALRNAGARVGRSCGTHVHHGAQDLDFQQVRAVVEIYARNQDSINGILSASRRSNGYCRPFSQYVLDYFASSCSSVSDMAARVDRYQNINLHSYGRYGTLEFRQHQGTLDYRKIRAWIMFGQALLEQGKEGNLTDDPFTRLDAELVRFFETRRSQLNPQLAA